MDRLRSAPAVNTLMYAGAVLNINGGYADLKTLNYKAARSISRPGC